MHSNALKCNGQEDRHMDRQKPAHVNDTTTRDMSWYHIITSKLIRSVQVQNCLEITSTPIAWFPNILIFVIVIATGVVCYKRLHLQTI